MLAVTFHGLGSYAENKGENELDPAFFSLCILTLCGTLSVCLTQLLQNPVPTPSPP